MKKQNPIDDLFRSELADYRVVPSDERRAAFMREAVGKYSKGSRPFWWIAGVVAIFLIGVGTAVFVLEDHSPAPVSDRKVAVAIPSVSPAASAPAAPSAAPSASSASSTPSVSSAPSAASAPAAASAPSASSTPSASSAPSAASAPAAPSAASAPSAPSASSAPAASSASSAPSAPGSAKSSNKIVRSNEINGNKTNTISTPHPAIPDPASQTPHPAIPDPASQTPHSAIPDQREALNPASTAPDPAISHPDIPSAPKEETTKSPAKPETQNEEKKATYSEKSYPPKKWNISAGVYYTPEWMFNTLNGDKFVNNFGVEGTFHFGRYSVRTGVGLSITTGSNEMLRQTNSYLGAYNALDSISFQWNQKHTSLVPTYYTQQKTVYDSSLTFNYSYNKKRYTYLQVPLILGYDFWQNSWLSLGVRGGAVMSLLVKSENLSDTYNQGNDKVISINNVSPDRIQLNWQGIGGINATFRLSRRFSLEVEPDVRYYFNSVYESSEVTTKPWSLGVRAAFVVTW